MRIYTLYRHGFTMGTPPRANSHVRGKRGTVGGWSASSTRNNIAFLRSVNENHENLFYIDGRPLRPLAVTLTVRDCPPTSEEFHKLRHNMFQRLKRMGMVYLHWVIEWTNRGVPHLHLAAFMDTDLIDIHSRIIHSWCDLARDFGTTPKAQNVKDITDHLGWSQYVAKHCARGVGHYQRSPHKVPKAWQMKTGRVWGKWGNWPIQEPIRFSFDDDAYYKFRRIARSWRKADSRAEKNVFVRRKRILSARRMLKNSDPNRSNTIGVSEWLPEQTQLSIMYFLKSQGFRIEC